jgi:chemotaxis protein CheX
MKLMNESSAVKSSYQDWVPLMELATREVFELMLNCKLAAPEVAVNESFDTTSMVGLAGKICGILTFSCGARSDALMASKMLGLQATEGSREVLDAIGEICNMVAGNFKNKVAGLGEGCMLSVPTVITGNNYSLHSLADSAALEVRLLFEGMPFVISLRVHS